MSQVDDGLLEFLEFLTVNSVKFVVFGVVSFGKYCAQLDDTLILFILGFFFHLQLLVVKFLWDNQVRVGGVGSQSQLFSDLVVFVEHLHVLDRVGPQLFLEF